jgi:hypothetical protein
MTMKSEILVVNAVKSSEKAFASVAAHIDCSDLERLMKVLQSPERVKQEERRLNLSKDQLFVFLEKAIRDAFEQRPLARLTREHLSALLENDLQKHLSKLLDCPVDEVLQSLFSVPSLQDTLEYLDRNASRFPANAKLLLNEILKPNNAQKLQNTYAATSSNWEIILKNEEWLEHDAIQRLTESDVATATMTPFQILGSLIDQYKATLDIEADKTSTDVGQIDAIGLLELRRRVSSIINNLYEQSITTSQSLPKSPIMQFIVSLIYIYELGYVAKGIHEFINTSSKLKELLATKDYFPMSIEENKVNAVKPLVYGEEKIYTLSGQEIGNFEIGCTVDGKEQTILKVIGAPEWVCRQLRQDIPQLTPLSLRGEGNTICERLLNISFPLEPERTMKLREAIGNMEPAFTQAVVLSSDGKISGIPNVWGSPIPDRLQFDELPVANDPEYVTDVEEHIAKLMSLYGLADNVVRRGVKPKQQESDQREKE